LQAWLDIRDRQLPLEGRVFARIRHDGQLIGYFSSQSIYNALSKRAMQADVWHITPHDLRRTFVTRLLERNVDTFIVAKLVGHADPRTTAIYDRRAEQEAKKAVAQLDFP
jgi:integrase